MSRMKSIGKHGWYPIRVSFVLTAREMEKMDRIAERREERGG